MRHKAKLGPSMLVLAMIAVSVFLLTSPHQDLDHPGEATMVDSFVSTLQGALSFGQQTISGAAIIEISESPTISSVTINSTSPNANGTTDNITIHVSGAGGTNQSYYNFYVNHTRITVFNMAFTNGTHNRTNSTVDYSPLANNGTVVGAIFNETGGPLGTGSYEFDEVDDYIDVGGATDYNFTSPFSVTAWIRAAATWEPTDNHYHNIITKGSIYSAGWGLNIYERNTNTQTQISFFTRNSSLAQSVIVVDNEWAVNEWIFVVGVYNGTHNILYVNATEVNNITLTDAGKPGVNNASLMIGEGSSANAADAAWDGGISHIQIFNRSLTSAQIWALYQNMTNTIVNEETAVDDVWNATAIANDGSNASAPVSSGQINIASTSYFSSFSLDFASADHQDSSQNITISAVATDPQSQPLKTLYNWYRNNTAVTIVNMPFENSTETTSLDYSGRGSLGVSVLGAAYHEDGGFDDKGAYLFDGTNDYMTVADSPDHDFKSHLSITGWVNLTDDCNQDSVILHDYSSYKYMIYCSGTTTAALSFYVRDTGGVRTTGSSQDLNDGQYHHFAAVYDQTRASERLRMYVDGLLVGTHDGTNAPIAAGDEGLHLGTQWNSLTSGFPGYIDELVLWNISLSPEQVWALYQNDTGTMTSSQLSPDETWQVQGIPNNGIKDGSTSSSTTITVNHPTCGTLNNDVTLTQDVSSTGTCFEINASGVTIDCNGFTINYSSSGTQLTYAINNTAGHDDFTVQNCIIRETNASGSDKYAIRLTNVANALIDNNSIYTIGSDGTSVDGRTLTTSNITNNLFDTRGVDNGFGLDIDSASDFNIISGNTLIMNGSTSGNSGWAMYISNSDNNLITQNVIETYNTSNQGIMLTDGDGANYNNITYNNITSIGTGSDGIDLGEGTGNRFIGNRVFVSGANGDAIQVRDGKDNYAENNTFDSTQRYDLLLSDGAITMVNNTFNQTNIYINTADTGNVSVQWYTTITVQNSSDVAQASANVTVYNVTSDRLDSKLTDSAGVAVFTLEEFFKNDSVEKLTTPHQFNVTLSGYLLTSLDLNLTAVQSSEPTVTLTDVVRCEYLNSDATLTENIQSDETCITINASNIQLNCNGYSINYSRAGILGYGINNSGGFNDVNITNCLIYEGNTTTSDKYGINWQNAVGGFISANTIVMDDSTDGHAIYFNAVNHTQILNNTLTTFEEALLGFTGQNITIANNTLSSSQAHTVFISSPGNYTFDSNRITSTGTSDVGLYLNGPEENTITNNNITTTGVGSEGIYFFVSSYNTLTGNTINATQDNALVFRQNNVDELNHTIDKSNLANGLPILFNFSLSDTTFQNQVWNTTFGQVICNNCTRITYRNVSFGGDGLTFAETDHSIIANSTFSSILGSALYITESSDQNLITENNIQSSTGVSMVIISNTAVNNNFTYNIANQTATSEAVFVSSSDNNIIGFNSIESNSQGLELATSDNTLVTENSIVGSASVFIDGSSENNLLHNNNISQGTLEIDDRTGDSVLNYIVYNNSFGEIRWSETADDGMLKNMDVSGSYLGIGWGINISQNLVAFDADNFGSADPINSSVNITLYQLPFSSIERIYRLDNYTQNPAKVQSAGTDCSSTSCLELSDTGTTYRFNTTYPYSFSVNGTEPSDCGQITQDHTQNRDINATAACLQIISDHVTYDCAGFGINYSETTAGYAINITARTNVTIKNCVIDQVSSTASQYPIYVEESQTITIENNTIHPDNSTGADSDNIYLLSSNHSVIRENTLFGNNVDTIALFEDMHNLTITNNTMKFTSSSRYGVNCNTGAMKNLEISNNTIITSGSSAYAIQVSCQGNLQILENKIRTSDDEAQGIFLNDNNGSTLLFNDINASKSAALILDGDHPSEYNHTIDETNLAWGLPIWYNQSVQHQTLIADQDLQNSYGAILCANCNNVTYSNVNISNDGFSILNSTNVLLQDVIVNSSVGHAIYFASNGGNNIVSRAIINNTGTEGHGIYFDGGPNNLVENSTINVEGSSSYPIEVNTDYINITNNQLNSSQTNSYGISLGSGDDNNRITHNKIRTTASSSDGISMSNTDSNIIENNEITTLGGSAQGIQLAGTSFDNILKNNNLSAGANLISDSTGADDINYLVYNNTFGEIWWDNKSFLDDIEIDGDELGLDLNIHISQNLISVNISTFTDNSLNTSSNITLFTHALGQPTDIITLQDYTTSQAAVLAGTNCTTCVITTATATTLTFNSTYLQSFTGNDSNNYLPQILTLNLSAGTTNATSQNLTANVTTTDVESETVKVLYNWHVNGTNINLLTMPLENHTGGANITAVDLSAYEHNGTVEGAIFNATGGYDGWGAYEFDGAGATINLSNPTTLNNITQLTVSFWMKPNNDLTASSGRNDLVSKAGAYWFLYDWQNGQLSWVIGSGSTHLSYTTTFTDGQWYHVVGTLEANDTTRLYIDGVEVGTATQQTSPTQSAWDITLARSASASGNYYEGTLDEIEIFNKSLSPKQVLALYQNKSFIQVSAQTVSAENWSVTAIPLDSSQRGTNVQSSNVTIIDDQQPSVSQTAANATTVLINESFKLNASITDDAGLSTITFTIQPFGNLTPTNSGSEYFLVCNSSNACNTTSLEEINWTHVYASDTTGNERVAVQTIQINVTTLAPVISGATLNTTDPSTNTTNQNITSHVTATDGQGDNITLIYTWLKNEKSELLLNAPFENTSLNESNETRDYAVPANTLTVLGPTWGATSGYNQRGAYTFDGSNDYIDAGNNSNLNPRHAITVEAWVKTSTGGYVVAKDPDPPSYSFFEGWESNTIDSNWTVIGEPGSYNRTQTADSSSACGFDPNTGSRMLTFDVTTNQNYETNGIKTAFDFTGASEIILNFAHVENGDEQTACSDHVGDDSNCDGYFFTCDGSQWYQLGNLGNIGSTWTNVSVNISADSDFCSNVTSDFAIKITQYDNYDCSTSDGRGIDDINITYDVLKSDVPYALSTHNGGEFLIIKEGTIYNASAQSSVLDNNWHHLVGTYDGAQMKLYVDGALQATNTQIGGRLPTNNLALWIGRHYNPQVTEYFNGTIDEVRIWNRTLSPKQIQNHFNNLTGIITSGETQGETWNLTVTANDGSYDSTSLTTSGVTIADTIVPGITINTPVRSNISRLRIQLSAAITEEARVTYSLDGQASQQICASCEIIEQNIRLGGFGNHSITLTATDAAGNTNSSTLQFNVSLDTDGDGVADTADADADNDGITDTEDNLIGGLSNVETELTQLNITVNNSADLNQNFSVPLTVNITNGSRQLVHFIYNFSGTRQIAWGNVTISIQNSSATAGTILISGIDLGPNNNKTVIIDDISDEEFVCIEDAEITSITQVTTHCGAAGEIRLRCAAEGVTSGNYTCTDLGSQLRIEGLRHSGVREVGPAASASTSSGTGGGESVSGGGGATIVEAILDILPVPRQDTPSDPGQPPQFERQPSPVNTDIHQPAKPADLGKILEEDVANFVNVYGFYTVLAIIVIILILIVSVGVPAYARSRGPIHVTGRGTLIELLYTLYLLPKSMVLGIWQLLKLLAKAIATAGAYALSLPGKIISKLPKRKPQEPSISTTKAQPIERISEGEWNEMWREQNERQPTPPRKRTPPPTLEEELESINKTISGLKDSIRSSPTIPSIAPTNIGRGPSPKRLQAQERKLTQKIKNLFSKESKEKPSPTTSQDNQVSQTPISSELDQIEKELAKLKKKLNKN